MRARGAFVRDNRTGILIALKPYYTYYKTKDTLWVCSSPPHAP